MLRTSTMTALALAVTIGGAAMAQQSSGTNGASGEASAGVGAPASQGTGVKGVYSTKRMMGISTGQPEKDAEAPGASDTSAEADENAETKSE